jgi:hypothetical protein
MSDTATIDMTTDEALVSSLSEHKIDELKLEPYSLLRQSVSSDLCDGPPGSFFNAVMTCWVCTLSPKEALKVHKDPEEAQVKAFDWAEKNGYSLWNWKPVVEAYNRMQREWYAASKAHIRPGENGDAPDPNSGGQAA